MKVNLYDTWTYLELNELEQKRFKDFENGLKIYTGVREEGFQFSKAYKLGVWDGITPLYDMDNHRLPTGLRDQLDTFIKEYQNKHQDFIVEMQDNRTERFLTRDMVETPIKVKKGGEELTLRDYQEASVLAGVEEMTGVLYLAVNSGKCKPIDTFVLTAEYGYKTLGEIAEMFDIDTKDTTEREISINIDLVNRYGEVETATVFTVNGVRKTRKLKLQSGTTLVGTFNHPYLVLDESGEYVWKETGDLKVGDQIVRRVSDEYFGNDSTLSYDEAYFVGLMIADANIQTYSGSKLAVLTTEQEEIVEFSKRMAHTWGDDVLVKRYEDTKGIRISFKKGTKELLFNKAKVKPGVSINKEVPRTIMEGTRESVMGFLAGYLEAEGYFGKSDKVEAEVISKSKKLNMQVAALLRQVGVEPRLSTKIVKTYPDNIYYKISLSAANTRKLAEVLKFKTKQRQQQARFILESYPEQVERGMVYSERFLREFAIEAKAEFPKEYRDKKLSKRLHPGNNVSRSYIKKTLSMCDSWSNLEWYKKLENVVDEGYLYDPVVSIDEVEKFIPTFDLHMPKTNSFIAEGVINHNTLTSVGLINTFKPYLENKERICYIVPSKQIFTQAVNTMTDQYGSDVGFIGDGKFKDGKVMVILMPSLVSKLKDPTKGKEVKLTGKKREIQLFVEEVLPNFDGKVNLNSMLRSFIRNYERTYKMTSARTNIVSYLESLAAENMSDARLKQELNGWRAKYEKIIRKLVGDKLDVYNNALELVKNTAVLIVDECLVEGTPVLMNDGSTKSVEELNVGDILWGKNRVTDTIIHHKRDISRVIHKYGIIEGTPTHPVAVLDGDDITYKPLMMLKSGDRLLTKKNNLANIAVDKTSDSYLLARLYGMIVADGHWLQYKKKDGKYHPSNTVRVNVSKDFEWYREVWNSGMTAFSHVVGYDVHWDDKLDKRGNLVLRITNPDFVSYMKSLGLIYGKKSDTIRIPKSYRNNNELMVPFTEGYFGAEASLVFSGTAQRLIVDTSSPRLQKEVAEWLNTLGVYPTILRRDYGESQSRNDIYRLAFSGKDLHNLYKIVPIMERKMLEVNVDRESHSKMFGDYYISEYKETMYLDDVEDVYDITTENHTFIGGGVLNHNCHHSKADTWYDTIMQFDKTPYKFGMTGSIDYKDKLTTQRLWAIFHKVIYNVENNEMVERGISSRPTIQFATIREPKTYDLTDAYGIVQRKQLANEKDYAKAYQAGIVDNELRNRVISNFAVASAKSGKPTLITITRMEHGNALKDKITELGGKVEFINGEQTTEERAEILDRMRKGVSEIMIASSMVDEGMDIDIFRVLIMAAGGKSKRQTIQRVGRVLRKKKEDNTSIVLDFVERTNTYLYNQSKERIKIYENEGFDIKYIN